MKLYTNSNDKLDFFGKRLENISKNSNLYISVAFFSHSDYILNAIKNGCSKIDLIVRLDFGTNPDELIKLIDNPNVVLTLNLPFLGQAYNVVRKRHL